MLGTKNRPNLSHFTDFEIGLLPGSTIEKMERTKKLEVHVMPSLRMWTCCILCPGVVLLFVPQAIILRQDGTYDKSLENTEDQNLNFMHYYFREIPQQSPATFAACLIPSKMGPTKNDPFWRESPESPEISGWSWPMMGYWKIKWEALDKIGGIYGECTTPGKLTTLVTAVGLRASLNGQK